MNADQVTNFVNEIRRVFHNNSRINFNIFPWKHKVGTHSVSNKYKY